MNLLPYFLLPCLIAANIPNDKLSWSTGKPMWPATSDLTSTLAPDGNIYLAGGCMSSSGHKFQANLGTFKCDAVSSKFFSYNPATNQYFSALPNLPIRRFRHAAAAANGHLFIFGGRKVTDELVLEIHAFDFTTQIWKVVGQLTPEQAASDLGAFSDGNNNIYMVGGYDASYNAKKEVWRIDTSNPNSVSVSAAAPLWDRRGDVRAHADGDGFAYVVGGYTHENSYCPALRSTERFNLATGQWTKLNDLQTARANMAVTTLGGHVLTVGGESPASSDCNVFFPEPGSSTAVLDSVEIMDDGNGNNGPWQMSSTNALSKKRYRFGDAVTVGSKAYFFGGLDEYDSTCKCYKPSVEVLILTYDSAVPVTPSPVAATPAPVPPTPAPVEETDPPTLATGGIPIPPPDDEDEDKTPPPAAFCFASETTVEVWNKGRVAMKDLSIGDKVKVAGDKFSDVYSFGHYEPDAKGEYLSIDAGLNKPLLITPDHMVLVNSNNNYVPASLVTVGDTLSLANGSPVSVQSIKSVIREGAFAPFTKDGSIVVNDIVASSFVALEPDSASFMVGGYQVVSLHTLAHLFEAPHRLICEINSAFCTKETYNEQGLSAWIEAPLAFSQWLVRQAAWIKISIAIPALVLFSGVAVLEAVVSNPVLLLVGFVTALLLKQSVDRRKA